MASPGGAPPGLFVFKVGNHQLHGSLVSLLGSLVVARWSTIAALYPRTLTHGWRYLARLALCTARYLAAEGDHGQFRFIREVIGLPTFLVILPLAWHLFRSAVAESRSAASPTSAGAGGAHRARRALAPSGAGSG